ncbi:hypothetical protein PIB30_077007 [Stylosanthes scabra]|uniref:serine O-acetyltransferase n=1 Tax=Stylosanthes scabra TaxID=79078 RepID=A0ABU6ZP01_9FABA|nr:hypothetical protein [Stylosanthes scabra]
MRPKHIEDGDHEHHSNDHNNNNNNNSLFSTSPYHLERIFPVYAMGIPNSSHSSSSAFHNNHFDDISLHTIWDHIREEAKFEAEREPILSSFLYASILSHDCLEQALAFAFNDRDPSCLSYCSTLLYTKGYHSLQVYRVAHALWGEGRKVLALALQSRVSEVFGIDIHPAAKIGNGILLDHGTGVVIGETAIVGNSVSLMQGVTLGGTGKEGSDRHPKVGEGVLIGASAIILGNIHIGEGVMIAAGSLVLKHVPPHRIVAGVPAQVIGRLNEHDPSLTMNHGKQAPL